MCEVVVHDAGPLYVRLKYDNNGDVVRVVSWDSTPRGGPGPIEVQGIVRIGDALLSINGKSLRGIGFKACIITIKQASRPRILLFHRASCEKRITSLNLKNCSLSEQTDNARSCCVETCIDEAALRKRASSGLPDGGPAGTSRPLVWRILLHYLPLERYRWLSHATAKRDLYQQFLEEFTIDPDCRVSIERCHPYKSMWTQLQLDSDLKSEIHKDVIRTHLGANVLEGAGAVNYDAMKRILFVYAKLNPGVRYVQGMNEILGTLFYVFASDPDKGWARFAEADTFFCFTNLMSEIRDVFIHSLDNLEIGLQGKIAKVNKILQHHDPELWHHLNSSQLNPAYYSLRWITTLLAREFSLGDTVRLWDAIFAEHMRIDFLCYFCVSMLLTQRSSLLRSDFNCCLHLLQNYPPSDPELLLRKTVTLRHIEKNTLNEPQECGSWSDSVFDQLRLVGATGFSAWFRSS